MQMRAFATVMGVALGVLVAPSVQAQAREIPAYLPVQGYLTDESTGEPLDGDVMLALRLYTQAEDTSDAAAAAPFHSEEQSVQVNQGNFTTFLGDGTPLDMNAFRDKPKGIVFLGIAVNGGAEMQPRLQLGAAPFAAFAQSCGDAYTLGGASLSDIQSAGGGDTPMVGSRSTSGRLSLMSTASAGSDWTAVDRHGLTCPRQGAVLAHGYMRVSVVSSSSDTTAVAGLRLIRAGVPGDNANSRFVKVAEGLDTTWSGFATFACNAGQALSVDLQARAEPKGDSDQIDFFESWIVLQFVESPHSERDITLP